MPHSSGPLAYKLIQFIGRFAMGIGATLCHVLREDTVHANAMPQREFRAGVGGSQKRAGGVRYVVIGGGGSSSSRPRLCTLRRCSSRLSGYVPS